VHPSPVQVALALALGLTPVAPAARAEPAGSAAAETPTATLAAPRTEPSPPSGATEVTGVVKAVDLVAHRVAVLTSGSEVEFGWDRNTLIYQPGGAATAVALRPGVAVRAGVDGRGLAYWIQVRPQATPAHTGAAAARNSTPAALP
jgi:hypothetical protein